MQLMIRDYKVTELIYEGVNSIIYRGVSESTKKRVVLKVLKAEYPNPEQVARLKHEYAIIENLDNAAVVKVLSLENYQNRFALVLEDFGGVSLRDYLRNEELSLVSFLSIAVQLGQALVFLHEHHIIHKDIKPANIIINPQTSEVKLTDFSIASRLDKYSPQIVNVNQLEGTLGYISPEQTGRMNRSVDYRSDFYSLGVTFYEMLTGQLPFQCNDAIELIYCHIAKQAPNLQELKPDVPKVLAAIVAKLMSKNAFERYQSANGLLKDLQRCLNEVKSTGFTEFVPAESDRSSQLLIPEKLYGRSEEVKTLLAAFERVARGETNKSTLVLVSGYSGIGKSSLVHEIHKPVVETRGFFISGKFDQFQRVVPYTALVQAFKSLIRQLLTQSAQELEVWKHKLLTALGVNGQIIIDIFPEVELIIGCQPSVVVLGANEAQNRFNLTYLFKDYQQAANYGQLAEKITVAVVASAMIPQHNFYYSLALLARYPDISPSQQELYLQQVELNQEKMRTWALYCPSNYQNKFELVEAEKLRVLGKYWNAIELYECAIKNASENGFVQEEALASELMGEFYLALGKTKIANLYLSDAYYAYQRWGANAKLKQLEVCYPFLKAIISQSIQASNTSNTISITNTSKSITYKSGSFDMATVIKAYQTLSSEIVIDKLLAKLMQLLREYAGAQKVYFLSAKPELYVEAALDANSDTAKVLQSIPIAECNQLPAALIRYVQRTGEYLILDDTNNVDVWSKDNYIQAYRPLSALVFPVVDKGALIGILYLENNLVKGAFTSSHIELLNIIAAQAAISLLNASFYTTLEQKVEERTTELRQTQLKLIQSEKMSSLGQLVAGIAHEINNPINFIQGNITYTQEATQSLLDVVKKYQQETPDGIAVASLDEIDLTFIEEDLPKAFMSMKNGVLRVKEIVLALRNFARLDEADYKQADIHEGLNNTLMILKRKLENIQIVTEYAKIPQVFCFAGELNQVFMHLLNNAIDAVKSSDTPSIIIKTEVKESNQIAICITDNGQGISPEVKPKIFDPFFTTKPVGQGTGLGLSISHQIVVQHGGQLLCSSQLGSGAEFTVLLPCGGKDYYHRAESTEKSVGEI